MDKKNVDYCVDLLVKGGAIQFEPIKCEPGDKGDLKLSFDDEQALFKNLMKISRLRRTLEFIDQLDADKGLHLS